MQQQESEHGDQVSGTSVAERSQDDPCLGKKISLYLYLDKEKSRVILDILVCQNISSIQLSHLLIISTSTHFFPIPLILPSSHHQSLVHNWPCLVWPPSLLSPPVHLLHWGLRDLSKAKSDPVTALFKTLLWLPNALGIKSKVHTLSLTVHLSPTSWGFWQFLRVEGLL